MGTFRPRLSDGASDPRVKPEDDERREARKNRAQKRIEGRCFGRTLGINPSPSPGWTLVRYGSGLSRLGGGRTRRRSAVPFRTWASMAGRFPCCSVSPAPRRVAPLQNPDPVSAGFPRRALIGSRLRRLKPGSPRSSAPRCPSAKSRSHRTDFLASAECVGAVTTQPEPCGKPSQSRWTVSKNRCNAEGLICPQICRARAEKSSPEGSKAAAF